MENKGWTVSQKAKSRDAKCAAICAVTQTTTLAAACATTLAAIAGFTLAAIGKVTFNKEYPIAVSWLA